MHVRSGAAATSRALARAAIASAIVLAACAQSEAPGNARESAVTRISPSDGRIRWVGRVDRTRPSVARMAWPGTALTLRFRGESLVLRLRDVPRIDETPDTDWIGVRIDDGPWRAFRLRDGEARYPIARGLARTDHRVLVVKRTEAEVGVVELLGIELPAGARLLAAPPRRTRRIEVLGDSVTAGFGNRGPDAACAFSAATEDATAAYAFLASEAVGADASLIAWSGKGVSRNADPRDAVPLPPLYAQTIPGEPARWDFRADPPDVVLVNLGANDFFLGIPQRDGFVAAYRDLIAHVRAARGPTVPLLLVLSPMLYDDATHTARRDARAWIDALVEERRRAGDTRIWTVDQWADLAEGFGCQFHPSARAHVRLARELVAVLRERLGW